MKVQELISRLLNVVNTHGDIHVVVALQTAYGWGYADLRFLVGDLEGKTKVVIMP
jgi:hypothetical protein